MPEQSPEKTEVGMDTGEGVASDKKGMGTFQGNSSHLWREEQTLEGLSEPCSFAVGSTG